MIINSLKIIPCLLSTWSGASLIKQPNKTIQKQDGYITLNTTSFLYNNFYNTTTKSYDDNILEIANVSTKYISVDGIVIKATLAHYERLNKTEYTLYNDPAYPRGQQSTFQNLEMKFGCGYIYIEIENDKDYKYLQVKNVEGILYNFLGQWSGNLLSNIGYYDNNLIFSIPTNDLTDPLIETLSINSEVNGKYITYNYTANQIMQKVINAKKLIGYSLTSDQWNNSEYRLYDYQTFKPNNKITITDLENGILIDKEYLDVNIKGNNKTLLYWNRYNEEETPLKLLNTGLEQANLSKSITLEKDIKITFQAINTQTIITQEVIDIPSIMFEVLTMPFTFISTAFNLTLFPGTQYMINISDIVFMILGTMIIIFLVKLIFSKVKG